MTGEEDNKKRISVYIKYQKSRSWLFVSKCTLGNELRVESFSQSSALRRVLSDGFDCIDESHEKGHLEKRVV